MPDCRCSMARNTLPAAGSASGRCLFLKRRCSRIFPSVLAALALMKWKRGGGYSRVSGQWTAMAAVTALALLWLGIAAAIAVVAARRFRLAQQVLDAAQAN